MSNVTIQRGDKQNVIDRWVESSSSETPVWWIVFSGELGELWKGGKALNLIVIYCILLGIELYVLSRINQSYPISQQEILFLTLQGALVVGPFIGAIIGADSISGERERATLEALLLTPASRRQIVVGKFLAALSPWPAALAIAVPYLNILAQSEEGLGQALLWGVVLGSLLVLAFTGVGILMSFWCNSSKTSLLVSLVIYLLCLLPTQFPGSAQPGVMRSVINLVNPLAAINRLFAHVRMDDQSLGAMWSWLLAPLLFTALVCVLLFVYAGSGLRLEAGRPGSIQRRQDRAVSPVENARVVVS